MFRIKMTGEIGWDITPYGVDIALQEAAGQDIEVDLSSIGGQISKGILISDLFMQYKKDYPAAQMILNIKAEAQSMASHFASLKVFDIVTVLKNSLFMIHNPMSFVFGDYREMDKMADFLKRYAAVMAIDYVEKSGKSVKEIRSIMDEETYFFGQEIIDAGFADILADDKIDDNSSMAKDKAIIMSKEKFKKLSEKIRNQKPEKEDFEKAVAKVRSISMTVGSYDANIEIIEATWSKAAADKRWRAHTDAEDEPNAAYRKAFLWHDGDNPDLFGSYKLMVKDYIGGREVVNIRAVNNADARLNQTDGPTADEKKRIQSILDRYQTRWDKEQEEEMKSTQPAEGGKNNIQEEISVIDSKELQEKFPAVHAETMKAGEQSGVDSERERVKALMEMSKSDNYKDIPEVVDVIMQSIEDGSSVDATQTKMNAAMVKILNDPKRASKMRAELDSPGDISTGEEETVSGEVDMTDEDDTL